MRPHPTKNNPFDLAPSVYLNPFYNEQLSRTKNNETDDYSITCAIDQVTITSLNRPSIEPFVDLPTGK